MATNHVSDDIAELFHAAKAVRDHAHAPYSGFSVGAAIRAGSGHVFGCCNVENSAYPEGTCAEAGAISKMVAAGERVIDTIVTVCGGELVGTPCGGCRQKIREFATNDTTIVVCDLDGERSRYSMAELLPDSFGPEHLSGSAG